MEFLDIGKRHKGTQRDTKFMLKNLLVMLPIVSDVTKCCIYFGHFGHKKKEPNPVKPITQIMINL